VAVYYSSIAAGHMAGCVCTERRPNIYQRMVHKVMEEDKVLDTL